jgi:hypothetical protein
LWQHHCHFFERSAQAVAELGGMIVAAAKACDANPDRLAALSKRILAVAHKRPIDASDGRTFEQAYVTGYKIGAYAITSGKRTCDEADAVLDKADQELPQ